MKKPVFLYCLIAFTTTWAVAFAIIVADQQGLLNANQRSLHHCLAAIGPALAALVSAWYCYGRAGLRRLFEKLTLISFDRRAVWLALSPVLFFGLGLLLYRLFKGQWFDFVRFQETGLNTSVAVLAWVLPLFSYGILEEIGWRGFLLPHLQARFSAWKATLFLTVIWALWHLPFFFYRFDFSPFISIGFFFGLLVGSILLTSIYNFGKGALIPVILFHFSNNLASAFDKDFLVAVLSTCFVFLAISLFKRYGPEHLSSIERTQNYFFV